MMQNQISSTRCEHRTTHLTSSRQLAFRRSSVYFPPIGNARFFSFPAEEGVQCGLCMTTSPSVLDHPLVEELLQREHVQQRSRPCGQCGERGNEAIAAGYCAECSTELCRVCINVSVNHQLLSAEAHCHHGLNHWTQRPWPLAPVGE